MRIGGKDPHCNEQQSTVLQEPVQLKIAIRAETCSEIVPSKETTKYRRCT
jgi:hypothetical protein